MRARSRLSSQRGAPELLEGSLRHPSSGLPKGEECAALKGELTFELLECFSGSASRLDGFERDLHEGSCPRPALFCSSLLHVICSSPSSAPYYASLRSCFCFGFMNPARAEIERRPWHNERYRRRGDKRRV